MGDMSFHSLKSFSFPVFPFALLPSYSSPYCTSFAKKNVFLSQPLQQKMNPSLVVKTKKKYINTFY